MARSRNPRRAVATATALLGLLVVGSGGSAYAGVLASSTSATKSVGSGKWAVIPTLPAATPVAGTPLALTFSLTTTRVLFEAANTGTLDVTEASYNVVVSGGLLTPTVVLEACVGGTWTGLTTCTGTVTRIGGATNSWTSADSAKWTASPAAPTAAGSRLSLRATLSGLGATVTVNTRVTSGPTGSGQVRQRTTNG